jgi:hypothetical protein
MVALQIREVPAEVRDTLADTARGRGQSLQAYLLELVQTDARRARNAQALERFARRRDGARLSAEEVTAAVEAGRRG